jgi:hypothetical protein
VVVDEATGGAIVEDDWSVVVVLVVLSELPQAASKAVPASSAVTVKIRKRDVVLIMAGLRCHTYFGENLHEASRVERPAS